MSHVGPSSEFKMTFPWKLIVLFLIFSILILLAGAIYYQSQKIRIYKEGQESLRAIATLKIREIELWHTERMGDAKIIMENRPFLNSIHRFYIDPNQQVTRHELVKWMKAICGAYDYSGAMLLDTLLNPRLTVSFADSVEFTNIRKEIAEVIKDKKIISTNLHRSGNKNIHMGLLIPMIAPGGSGKKPFGVLLLRINPGKILFPLIQTWPTSSKSSETLLVQKVGDSIQFLNELRHRKNTALNLSISMSMENILSVKAAKGFVGVTEGVDYRNIPVIGYVSGIPGIPWYIVAKVDKEELNAPLQRNLIISIIIVILLIAVNGAVLVFWIREQRMQLYRLKLRDGIAIKQQYYVLKGVIESSQGPVYSIDKNYCYTSFNMNHARSMKRLYQADIVLGRNILDYYTSKAHRINAKESFDRSLAGEHVEENTWTDENDTEPRFLEIFQNPVVNELNEVLGVAVSIRDQTEKYKAEESLRNTRAILQAALDQSQAGIAIADAPDGKLIYVNDAGLHIRGSNHETAVDDVGIDQYFASWNILGLDGNPLGSDEVPLARAILYGEICNREFVIRRAPGDERIVMANAAPIYDDHGKVHAGIVVFMDITDRKQEEAELRFNSEIMAHIAEAVYLVRFEDGIIVYANSQFELMFGYGPGEMLGKNVTIVNAPTEKNPEEIAREIMTELAETGFWKGEVNNIKKDGTAFWCFASVTVFNHSQFGKVLISVHLDITEQKKAESMVLNLNQELEKRVIQRTSQLEAANKELEAFSYSVSHDLRAPLRAVHSFTNILLEEYEKALDEEGKRLCGIIAASATQMGELIDDLLNFSRIGRTGMNPELLDMKSLARKVFTEFSNKKEKAVPQVRIGNLHNAHGDKTLMKLVWTNLISNALKYSSNNPSPKYQSVQSLRDP